MKDKIQWIVELVDNITKPLKEIVGNIDKVGDKTSSATDNIDDLGKSILELRNDLKQFEQLRDNSFSTQEIRKYNEKIEKTQKELKKLENLPPKKAKQNWVEMSIAVNQTLEIVNKLQDSFSFTKELTNLENDIRRFGVTNEEEISKIERSVHRLAKVYNEDESEILRAANAMTKQIGGSFEENLALIQAGFEKGANLNKDMLDQLKEYGPQVKALGLDAKQTIAIMAQAGKEGIFSDKAIDALKEANLSLREMQQAQVNALSGIGLKVEDLAGKTTFEAVQMISKAMQGATTQAKQLVLADIFKGAGEDAGLGFIEGLANVDMDINNIPSIKQANEGWHSFIADLQTTMQDWLGNFGGYAQTIGDFGIAVMGMVQVYELLASSEAIATAAQWLLNAAMDAFPLIAIVSVVALGIGLIIKYWDELKEYFIALVEFWYKYLNPFSWLIELIDYVFPGAKKAIYEFFGGLWDWIYNNFFRPLIDAWNWIKDALGFGEDEKKLEANITITKKTEVKEPETEKPVLSFGKKKTGTQTGNKKTASAGTSSGSGGGIKNIQMHIDQLVGKIEVRVTNLKESQTQIKEAVSQALIAAVRDTEVAIS